LHAVAHGADALGAFGRSPHLDGGDLRSLLALAADRLLRPGGPVFADLEDERLGFAVAVVSTRPELDAGGATGWLADLGSAVGAALQRPGPIPARVSNASGTLRVLSVLVDRGVRPSVGGVAGPVLTVGHPRAVREAVLGTLRLTWPFIG
jgi:hypothetical protein